MGTHVQNHVMLHIQIKASRILRRFYPEDPFELYLTCLARRQFIQGFYLKMPEEKREDESNTNPHDPSCQGEHEEPDVGQSLDYSSKLRHGPQLAGEHLHPLGLLLQPLVLGLGTWLGENFMLETFHLTMKRSGVVSFQLGYCTLAIYFVPEKNVSHFRKT